MKELKLGVVKKSIIRQIWLPGHWRGEGRALKGLGFRVWGLGFGFGPMREPLKEPFKAGTLNPKV